MNQRLWPVLLVLTSFLTGVLWLEWVAEHREPTFQTIVVADGATARDMDDSTEQTWQSMPAVSEAHEHARQQLRRGDVDAALGFYRAQVASDDVTVPLLVEFAYALRQIDRCEEAFSAAHQAAVQAPDDGAVQLSLALSLRCLGRDGEASLAFAAALEARPNHNATRLAYGDFLRRRGAYDRAIEVLEPATNAGGNDERARALAHLGRCLFAIGDRASAGSAFNEAIERAPAYVSIWVTVARTYLGSDDPADLQVALEHAEQASRLAPDAAEPHSAVARALEKLGRSREAIDAYERAAELDPTYTYVRTRLVRLGLQEQELARALRAARELLEIDDANAEYHFLHGLAASRVGDAEQARASYEAAIATRGGDYPEAWFNLGILEREEGKLAASREAYQWAIELSPEYYEAWNNLGLVFHDMQQFGEAEHAFRTAITLREGYVSAWINLGRTYAEQDSYARAAEAYERALSIAPSNRTARLRLGVAYRRTGQLERAVETYESLVRDEPRYVSAWYNLGVARAAAGQTREAADAYRTAIRIDPDHVGAIRNLGLVAARLRDNDLAWRYLTDALDRDPSDREVRLAIAELALKRDDPARCRREVATVLGQDPTNAEALALAPRCP